MITLVVDATELGPGQTRAVEHRGTSVLLCNVDGDYYALENRCSHAAARLSVARLDGCLLECPVHGARFDVRDGSVARRPARRAIRTFPVVVSGGKVEIQLGP